MTVVISPRLMRRGSQQAGMRVVDLFAGAGGLSEGFRQAGFSIVAGTDVDPDAAGTYAANFPDAQVIVGDVRAPALRDQILDATRVADVIVGGPPCQAFSQVRNHSRLIDDPRNTLYREFVNIVAETLPLAFVMENVPGMDQMGVREQVAQDLSLDGEYVVKPQLVDAADFGVPQTRMRLLFLGVRSELSTAPPRLEGTGATRCVQLLRKGDDPVEYTPTARLCEASSLVATLADPNDLTAVTADQAIGDLRTLAMGRRNDILDDGLPPAMSSYQQLMRDPEGRAVTNVSVPRSRPDTVLRLRAIPPGGNHRDLSEELLCRYLTDAKWGPHNGSGSLSRRHYYAYRRLHPAIWAWTLNTKADSVYHYGELRCLSVREFARLQSFPDRFVFTTDARRGPLPGRIPGGAAHSRYRQVGNAVPPLLGEAAATALAKVLAATRARSA